MDHEWPKFGTKHGEYYLTDLYPKTRLGKTGPLTDFNAKRLIMVMGPLFDDAQAVGFV